MSDAIPLAMFMKQSGEERRRKEVNKEEKEKEEGLYEVLPQQIQLIRNMRHI